MWRHWRGRDQRSEQSLPVSVQTSQVIAEKSQGFVYLVSRTGVTGAQSTVEARVETLVDMLHSVTDKSVSARVCEGGNRKRGSNTVLRLVTQHHNDLVERKASFNVHNHSATGTESDYFRSESGIGRICAID